MPYSNVPKKLWGKMDRCVESVMGQGHDKNSAIGICYNSIVGGKDLTDSIENPDIEYFTDEEWDELPEEEKGGPGSGHHGHVGRGGERGGSAPAGSSTPEKPSGGMAESLGMTSEELAMEAEHAAPPDVPKFRKLYGEEVWTAHLNPMFSVSIRKQGNTYSVFYENNRTGRTSNLKKFADLNDAKAYGQELIDKKDLEEFDEPEDVPEIDYYLDDKKEVVIEVPDSTFERLMKTLHLKEEPSKTVDGKHLTADSFAHVPDKSDPSGWKLPIDSADRIADAITALQPGGFRGNPVQLQVPKSRVIARISRAIGKLADGDEKDRLRERLKKVKSLATSSFEIYKDIDGNFRWFGWVTNKWRDRDYFANPEKGGEILTDDAHKDYVDWVDQSPATRMPQLLAWHTMETAHKGRADWIDYADGFVMASGPLTLREVRSIARVQQDYDLGMSHGFLPLQKDRHEGLIQRYRTFEVSYLPLEVAANPWTEFRSITKEVFEMGLTEKKRGFLTKLMGDDFVEEIEKENATKAAELEAAGVDFKEETEPEASATEVVETPEAEVPKVDEVEEPEEGKEVSTDPVADLRKEMVEALTSVGEQFKTVNEAVGSLVKSLEAISEARKEADEEIEKAIEETPAASLRALFEKSVIGKEKARVDGRTSVAKDGPDETEPIAKAGKIGIPVLDAIKAANAAHLVKN